MNPDYKVVRVHKQKMLRFLELFSETELNVSEDIRDRKDKSYELIDTNNISKMSYNLQDYVTSYNIKEKDEFCEII